MVDAMIDVETLGNTGYFITTQISVVPFNVNTGEYVGLDEAFNYGISVSNSMASGFKMEPNTLKWWLDTNPIELKRQLSFTGTVDGCVKELTDYIDRFDIDRFWATATLDYQAINMLCGAVNARNPIPFNKRLCARTVRKIWERFGGKYERRNTHDAYEDCVFQIEDLTKAIRDIGITF